MTNYVSVSHTACYVVPRQGGSPGEYFHHDSFPNRIRLAILLLTEPNESSLLEISYSKTYLGQQKPRLVDYSLATKYFV